MSRWRIPETGLLRAPQGAHLALAVGVPTVFVEAAVYWLTGQVPSWPRAPLGLAYAVVMAVWTPWRLHTRQGLPLKVWFWVVPTLGLWAALAAAAGVLVSPVAWEGPPMVWFGVAFLQGQLAVLWAGQLASRARLFRLIEGVPDGRALEERFRDFQLDADFSRGNHATLSASLVLLGALAVVFATASPVRGPGPRLLLAAFLGLCLLVGVLLRTYRREMAALVYGRRFTWAEKVAPLGWSLLLVSLAALGAWALLGLGGPWLDFSHLVPNPEVVAPPEAGGPPASPSVETPTGDLRVVVLMTLLALILQLQRLGVLAGLLLQVLVWSLPWVGVAFLVWPVVRWLLAGGRGTKGLLRRWRRLLRAQAISFWRILTTWWQGAPEGLRGAPIPGAGIRDWLFSLLGRPGRGRQPYPAVVEAFLSIVRWAEPVTTYRPGETTREFLDRLAAAIPTRQTDLVLLRDWLDQELFAPRGLDAGQRRRFLALTAELTAPSHDPAAGVS